MVPVILRLEINYAVDGFALDYYAVDGCALDYYAVDGCAAARRLLYC